MAKVYERANPNNRVECEVLPIAYSEILGAYFAKAEITEVWEGNEKSYTVKSGDSLRKIAKAHQTTTVEIRQHNPTITKANEHLIKVGQKIKLSVKKRKGATINFTRINEAHLGDEVYVIVDVNHMSGRNKIHINIRQGKEDVLEKKDKALFVTFQGNETQLIEAQVNVLEKDSHKKPYLNASDYSNQAIAKVTLSPKTNANSKQWKKALINCDDQQTNLYLLVDAHTPVNIPAKYIKYKGYKGANDDNEVSNCFLNEDGEWFTLKANNSFHITMIRKWVKWTGDNKSSMTFSTFRFGDITGFICEPYGEETTTSGKDKRIPVGTYNLKWHVTKKYSKDKYTLKNKFGKKHKLDFEPMKNGVVRVYNEKVPESRAILIHAGQDGGWTEGCLLPSKTMDIALNKRNTSIKESVETLYKILDKIDQLGIENIKLTIKDETN